MNAAMAVAAELTPGTYLRLRREAAGRTLRETALIYAHTQAGATVAEMTLRDAERDAVLLGEPSLRRLQFAFHFDAFVYLSLAGEDLPVPPICRGCGCTWADACSSRVFGPCAWADAEQTICTACVRKAAAA